MAIYQATVQAEVLNGYSSPSIGSLPTGDTLSKDMTFTSSDIINSGSYKWIKYNNSYFMMSNGKNNYITMSMLNRNRATTQTSTNSGKSSTDGAAASISISNTSNSSMTKTNMRLFGLPYQFTSTIDPRISTVSTKVGRQYSEKILYNAPIVTIIPGKPKYLPNAKDKGSTTAALIEAASGSFNSIQTLIKGDTSDTLRFYDFERSYIEYMKYVNILCRSCATFLGLEHVTVDGTPLTQYDWRNWRFGQDKYTTVAEQTVKSLGSKISEFGSSVVDVLGSIKDKATGSSSTDFKYETTSDDDESEGSNQSTLEKIMTSYNYVQFYVDPDISVSENISNNTSESKMKSMFDSGSDILKELSFVMNSGGIDANGLESFASSAATGLGDAINSVAGGTGIGSSLSRIFSLSSNVIKGENVIMPDIYQNSSYDKSYTLTTHLRAPYGNKLCYYLEVVVPMMHQIALAIPKQTTANTYGSPFLVKVYAPGKFTCNMGIVSGLSITKNAGDSSTWTADGLPNEIDITMQITDLYSDLSMSPQSSPLLFVNNSSLIEYLAVNCGLSLITPNIKSRLKLIMASISNSFSDIDDNIYSSISEIVDNAAADFLGLTGVR